MQPISREYIENKILWQAKTAKIRRIVLGLPSPQTYTKVMESKKDDQVIGKNMIATGNVILTKPLHGPINSDSTNLDYSPT